jgi:hypothetical protein
MNSARDSTTSKTPEINWQDFNYPPLLKIIHFTPSELPEEHKSIIWMLFATHIIILVESLLNIINNSVQTAEGFDGIRILYSFLFLFLFNPLAFFIFYRGNKCWSTKDTLASAGTSQYCPCSCTSCPSQSSAGLRFP